MTTQQQPPPDEFWVCMCWSRIPAGPEPGGPPWLFIRPEHAEAYAQQLRSRGIDAQVHRWDAKVLEWRGKPLLQVPTIPPPAFPEGNPHNPAPESSDAAQANGTPLAPPPHVE